MDDPNSAASIDERIAKLPMATSPPYALSDPGTSVTLYNGSATITLRGETFQAPCQILLDWLPRPWLRCSVPPHSPARAVAGQMIQSLLSGPIDATLVLEDGTRIEDASLGVRQIAPFTQNAQFSLEGRVWNPAHPGAGMGASYVLFLVPNFKQPHGDPIRIGRGTIRGRNNFSGGGWNVTLDAAELSRESLQRLASNSGYAVTGVGRAEKADGSPAGRDEVSDLMHALNWYFSLVSSRWTGPCLARGYADDGTLVWDDWYVSRVDPYRTVGTWVNGQSNEQLSDSFPAS